MSDFNFVITNDNSVGLYNCVVDDIYHSSYGAYLESVEKFIIPSNFENFNNKNILILDICYGIGYNTKSAIQKFINLKNSSYLSIDCIDIDRDLVYLSPFIKVPQYEGNINNIIYLHLYDQFGSNFKEYINNIYSNNNYSEFLNFESINNQFLNKNEILHNIYYQYISDRFKTTSKCSIFNKININFFLYDARVFIKNISKSYDLIFLDAFTPMKFPILWSYEFLEQVKRNINKNGKLITYSTSSSVRSALVKLGFNIGNILINNKPKGTIASLNKNNIKNQLNDFELGLLNTNAGVIFHDYNLNSSNEEILASRNEYILKNNLQSTSSYIKAKKRKSNGKI